MTTLHVRRPILNWESGPVGVWNPRRPELSHTLNAFQLALPYLEPYFIDAIKQALDRITDPQLKVDARAFCAQEANHSRQHKAYCRLLQTRYPRLAEFEDAIRQSLLLSRQNDPLEWRLAYTAGYEAITAQLARWLFMNADEWFEHADPRFADLMTWHAAEEIEHRHVAYDVLQAVDSSYRLRARGLMAALAKTDADINPVVDYMLEVDGYRGRPDSQLRRLSVRLSCAKQLALAALRYLAPRYNPAQEAEPEGYVIWQRDQAQAESRLRSAG